MADCSQPHGSFTLAPSLWSDCELQKYHYHPLQTVLSLVRVTESWRTAERLA